MSYGAFLFVVALCFISHRLASLPAHQHNRLSNKLTAPFILDRASGCPPISLPILPLLALARRNPRCGLFMLHTMPGGF